MGICIISLFSMIPMRTSRWNESRDRLLLVRHACRIGQMSMKDNWEDRLLFVVRVLWQTRQVGHTKKGPDFILKVRKMSGMQIFSQFP